MEPLQFLKRLAVLLPAPYQNLVRYHGVFANRSRFRPLLPLPPEANQDDSRDDDANASSHPCVIDPQLVDTLPEQQTVLPLDDPDDPDDLGDLGDPDDLRDTFRDLPAVRPRRLLWASLLKRSLGVDGLECPRCSAQMVLLAFDHRTLNRGEDFGSPPAPFHSTTRRSGTFGRPADPSARRQSRSERPARRAFVRIFR